MPARFRPGDLVIYQRQKHTPHPGPHAHDIRPEAHGDYYSYLVDKFWRVVEVRPDGAVVVSTKKGKRRTVAAGDPGLRRARWWEWLWFRHRFPPRSSGDNANRAN